MNGYLGLDIGAVLLDDVQDDIKILVDLPGDKVIVHILLIQQALATMLHVDLLEFIEFLVLGIALIGIGQGS